MTLFKQVALVLSLFLLAILATVLVLNFQSASKSVEERLYEDAKNSATSLSLSLGNANGDLSAMSTMINANFDSGNYRYIALHDVDKKSLYERKNESDIKVVPEWFVSLISLKAPVAYANVSAGWSQVGVLHVQSDAAYAYKQLYTIFTDLLLSFSLITIGGLVVLNLLIHAVLQPLKEVQKQAAAVIRNEFITQEKIPYTTEFRDVVLGMNNMVSKVKVMFEKGNEELKAYKEREYRDQDTGLRNRKYFIDKLPSYLKSDSSYDGGINMLVAFNGIVEANEKLGHREVDKLFAAATAIFKEEAEKIKDSIVARMNGTEFSLLLPGLSDSDALESAKTIKQSIDSMMGAVGAEREKTFISIGMYGYSHTDTIAELLSHTDNALSIAKFNGENIYLEKTKIGAEIMGKDAWRELIAEAIKKERFSFVSWSVIDTKTAMLAHNILTIRLDLDEKRSYSYAEFMSSAMRLGMSGAIYKKVIAMFFMDTKITLSSSTYSFRLPLEYLQEGQTYAHLSELLRLNASKLKCRLIIELPDKLVHEDSKNIREYIELFRRYDIDIGIFEFIGEGEDYGYLQNIRPAYIKAESSYFLTQSSEALSALKLITDAVGISLIAVGVMQEETLEKLKQRDIHVVQGSITQRYII